MRRIRRAYRRWARQLGPVLVWYAALAVLVVGADAALDWHRHANRASSFVHLHPHVGDHRHDDAGRRRGDGPAPESPHSSDDQSATLSLGSGAAPAPSVDELTAPARESGVTPGGHAKRLAECELTIEPWIPRGPPA